MVNSVETGKRYNNIKVLEYSHTNKHNKRKYKCKCMVCGKIFITLGTTVKTGRLKSCGCLYKKSPRKNEKAWNAWHTNI